jgi:GT2 family glycosyltransferase
VPAAVFFSVVLTTYARPATLRRALEAVAELRPPEGGFEVVVVDDGSPEPVEGIVDEFSGRLPLHLVRQENGGCARARNTGAAHARGEYLVFLDDDCAPPPGWLFQLQRGFRQDPEAMIGGRQVNILHENRFSAASQLLVDFLLEAANRDRRAGTYVNNIALRRSAFEAMGGFDPDFSKSAEDRDFCGRWVGEGQQIIYEPGITVDHAHHLTLRSYWRQHAGYGRGAFHRWRKHRRGPNRPGYYLRLLFYPFGRCPLREAVASLFLLVLAQAATLWGILSEVRR